MENRPTSTLSDPAVPKVADLLAQRGRILEWLARLDEHRPDARSRVVARIQADYQARLQDTVDQLSAHQESLRAELARARGEQRDAEARREEALDAMEEIRLRHLIGELDDSGWEERIAEMESTVAAAEDAERETRARVEHLEEVLAQIEAGVAGEGDDEEAAAAPSEMAAAAEPIGEEDPSPEAAELIPEVDTVPENGESDLAFLEELDRAIASSSEPVAPHGDEVMVDARTQRGVKCAECGYTNDVDAWYCGVCGVDLA